MGSVSIQNFTRRRAPRALFNKAAKTVLPGWEISLVFVGETRAQDLNKRLRRKTYIPNVLSYQVGPKSGEIIICPVEVKRQASLFELPASSLQLLLFIHGLLHLKGMRHGATMERSEQALLTKLVPSARNAYLHNVPSHRHRNRHRHLPGQAGGGRGAAR